MAEFVTSHIQHREQIVVRMNVTITKREYNFVLPEKRDILG